MTSGLPEWDVYMVHYAINRSLKYCLADDEGTWVNAQISGEFGTTRAADSSSEGPVRGQWRISFFRSLF